MSKAFDIVNHELLRASLYELGVSGTALNLLASYLENRKQYVQMDALGSKVNSKLESVDIGVPQGSSLGPLLFLIYVNALKEYFKDLEFVKVVQYADDTNILISAENTSELYARLQIVEDRLKSFVASKRLCINTDRTN